MALMVEGRVEDDSMARHDDSLRAQRRGISGGPAWHRGPRRRTLMRAERANSERGTGNGERRRKNRGQEPGTGKELTTEFKQPLGDVVAFQFPFSIPCFLFTSLFPVQP